ncbi:DUF1659 domain-containing protein [Virgibacillus sp. W0430]|uniref:DUF1659 domain-containing protein n=1 Tax=Virgibacillus sp. W0430 TaxID=3391580 RepID=UPI003F459D71
MAEANLMNSQLRLIFDDGTDLFSGEALYKSKNFNNVKTSATANQLYAVATAMAGLQQRPLYLVQRKDSTDIHEA